MVKRFGGLAMLKRPIKLLISFCFYLGLEGRRLALYVLGKTPPSSGVVLYYHHVTQAHCDRFVRQMQHLRRYVQPVRADHRAWLAPGTRVAAVTFDDGYLSTFENAAPELERLGIPATVFVVSDFLGQRLKSDPSERLMTSEELRRMASDLIAIGSHTASHTRMSAVDENQGRDELQRSRRTFEQILGRDITLFCFPFGSYNSEALQWCAEAGYQRVFTCDPTLAFRAPDEFVTGRVAVEPTDWPLEFHLKLMGAYRWLPAAFALKSRILQRLGAKMISSSGSSADFAA
jgi:peptidoglycan/xylan/chitin deacetylase (PgdA/CDA1 family)